MQNNDVKKSKRYKLIESSNQEKSKERNQSKIVKKEQSRIKIEIEDAEAKTTL